MLDKIEIKLTGQFMTGFPKPFSCNSLTVNVGKCLNFIMCLEDSGRFYIDAYRCATNIAGNDEKFKVLMKIAHNNDKYYKDIDSLVSGVVLFYKTYLSYITGLSVEDMTVKFELELHPVSIYDVPGNDFPSLKENAEVKKVLYTF